jgi:hypothetical protein
MAVFYHAEQTGNVVTFFDSTGAHNCLITDIEAYVEENRFNYQTIDDDQVIESRFATDEEYVDQHWDSISLIYWNDTFNK